MKTAFGGLPSAAWIWTLLVPTAAAGVAWLILVLVARGFDASMSALVLAGIGLVCVGSN